MKKLLTLIAITLLTIALVDNARALSCASAIFTESDIEKSEIIFEGKMIYAAVRTFKAHKGIEWGKETYKVTKAYKGVKLGESIDVYRNVAWGDGVLLDGTHLIATSKVKGRYIAPHCMNTSHYFFNEESRELLKKHF